MSARPLSVLLTLLACAGKADSDARVELRQARNQRTSSAVMKPLTSLAMILSDIAEQTDSAFGPIGFRPAYRAWRRRRSEAPLMSEDVGRVVVVGAGLHGAALAYYLTLRGVKPLVVERKEVAAAASGKGGGFLARDWGSGSTAQLHKVSFQLHEDLASDLGIESYRRIPVVSVQPGSGGTKTICPWIDGNFADQRMMDADGGAQVAPYELCTKLMEAAVKNGAELRIGDAQGVTTKLDGDDLECIESVIVDGENVPADKVCVCMGPWAALAEDWFDIPVPMTGIKSTSIVYKKDGDVEPYALFCGEDYRFGTHLEVYPRNNGEIYMCGIGGSEYVDGSELRAGKYPPGDVHPDPKRVAAAAASFSEMSKTFAGEPDLTQACMRPCPPDALPIMGKVGHIKGAYISAGHNCWGILWAPVSGKSMSELIIDGSASCVNLQPFAPSRFAGSKGPDQKGKRGRKQGTVAVGEQW